MRYPCNAWLTPTVVAILIIGSASAVVAQSDEDRDEERRVVVNVHPGGPRVWSFLEGGYLGIGMLDLTPELRSHFGVSEEAGVMISAVETDSPAAAAGLKVGDIVTSVDGEPTTGSRTIARVIGSREGGESVTLEVFRDGAYSTVEAVLDERERPQFWLNTLKDGGHGFEFHSEDGENVLLLPGPGSERWELKQERLDEVMGTLQERLESPEFSSRMLEFRSNTEELEERIKELEERLQELAEQLESIED